MSVFYDNTEFLHVHNNSRRTEEILEFVQDQFRHMLQFHCLDRFCIQTLEITLDGKTTQLKGFSAKAEKTAAGTIEKVGFPADIEKAISGMTRAKEVTVRIDWYFIWGAESKAGTCDILADYGPAAMLPALREEDADMLRYAALSVCDDSWVPALYCLKKTCDTVHLGKLPLEHGYDYVKDLQNWIATDTVMVAEPDHADANVLVQLAQICGDLAARFDDLQHSPVYNDASRFSFFLNEATLDSKEDIDFFCDSVKQIHSLIRDEFGMEAYFTHVSSGAAAAMRITLTDEGKIEIASNRIEM